MIRDMLASVD